MNLIDCLSDVKDFRRMQGQRYNSVAMLLIIIMSILRNKHCYRDIGRFCHLNQSSLIDKFGFKNKKVPSYVSIRTFILSTDFLSIQSSFHKWTQSYVSIEAGEWIAIDGKSIRSTVSNYSDSYQNFVSLVSLFCYKREQVLHVEMLENKKDYEGQIVEELLEILDLKDVIFTLDALYCKKTLNKIVLGKNHYVVKVKGNQPKLKLAIEETIISSEPIGYHREEAITRGRLEIRETYLYQRQDNLAKGWESINLIAYVHRNFLSKQKEHKTDSLYVSDLKTTDAKFIQEGIRSHWGIENKLHYTKDVIMREDKECTSNKTAAANLALLRDVAFNILKTENNSVKQATEIFANYNVKELINMLLRI